MGAGTGTHGTCPRPPKPRGDPGTLELLHQGADGVAEHLVGAVDDERGRPCTEVVQQDVHPVVVGVDAMEVRIDRDVPRKDVEGRVVGHRVLAEGQADLGREQQRSGRPAEVVLLHAVEHRPEQSPAAGVAGDQQVLADESTSPEVLDDADHVIDRRREGELGRQPVVGGEHRAPGDPGQVSHEEGVHPRRGADVPTAVQVDDVPAAPPPSGSASAGGRNQTPGTPPIWSGWLATPGAPRRGAGPGPRPRRAPAPRLGTRRSGATMAYPSRERTSSRVAETAMFGVDGSGHATDLGTAAGRSR